MEEEYDDEIVMEVFLREASHTGVTLDLPGVQSRGGSSCV